MADVDDLFDCFESEENQGQLEGPVIAPEEGGWEAIQFKLAS